MERDEQFLEYVVKALADNPTDVKIRRTVDEMGVLLTLSVNKDDMGKVIGRSGATAKAIDKAEDRALFREAMTRIGLETPRSHHVKTLSRALAALEDIGLPAIIRPSFTLGGSGGVLGTALAAIGGTKSVLDQLQDFVLNPRLQFDTLAFVVLAKGGQ